MATALEYFNQNYFLEIGSTVTIGSEAGRSYELEIKVVCDFDGGSKYLKIYIPESEYSDSMLAYLLNNSQESVWKAASGIRAESGLADTGELVSSDDLRFSGRVLVWTPCIIEKARWENLTAHVAEMGMALLVRDGNYVKTRQGHETPLAFISHDSRDKDAFVRKLANQLSRMSCPVWYDEYKLKPGDSLRASIEAGLKATPKCVLVLSKNFFSNPGWGRREFDSIYAREIVEGKRVMIPIWLDVTVQEVFDYSPILVDTFGIDAAIGVDEVARKLIGVLK